MANDRTITTHTASTRESNLFIEQDPLAAGRRAISGEAPTGWQADRALGLKPGGRGGAFRPCIRVGPCR